jgi:hypothetical protein
MYKSILLITVYSLYYGASPLYFLLTTANLSFYFYNYILMGDDVLNISTIVMFLNKLNNALLNPLIFIIILSYIITQYYYNRHIWSYRGACCVCLITLGSYWETHYHNYSVSYNTFTNFAPTLTNGLLIIHPLMLYTFYGLLFFHFICTPFIKKIVALGINNNYPYFIKKNKSHLFGLVALFLGSWWSHQELNWGGFWSWDLVEIFLLVTVIYVVQQQHLVSITTLSHLKSTFFFINFILYVFSVRYNLINSIHNFISQSNFLYKVTYIIFFYIILLFILFKLYYCSLKKLKFGASYVYANILLESFYIVVIIYVFITYIGFYIFSTSSSIFINIVPIFIYSVWPALFVSYASALNFYFPFIESLLFSLLGLLTIRVGPLSVIHLIFLLFFFKITVWYNIILLLPLGSNLDLLMSLTYNPASLIEITYYNWTNLNLTTPCRSLSLYLDNCSLINLLQSSYDLVVYSTPIFNYNHSLVIFLHKAFSKISFVECIIPIMLLVMMWISFLLKKNIKMYF